MQFSIIDSLKKTSCYAPALSLSLSVVKEAGHFVRYKRMCVNYMKQILLKKEPLNLTVREH